MEIPGQPWKFSEDRVLWWGSNNGDRVCVTKEAIGFVGSWIRQGCFCKALVLGAVKYWLERGYILSWTGFWGIFRGKLLNHSLHNLLWNWRDEGIGEAWKVCGRMKYKEIQINIMIVIEFNYWHLWNFCQREKTFNNYKVFHKK